MRARTSTPPVMSTANAGASVTRYRAYPADPNAPTFQRTAWTPITSAHRTGTGHAARMPGATHPSTSSGIRTAGTTADAAPTTQVHDPLPYEADGAQFGGQWCGSQSGSPEAKNPAAAHSRTPAGRIASVARRAFQPRGSESTKSAVVSATTAPSGRTSGSAAARTAAAVARFAATARTQS